MEIPTEMSTLLSNIDLEGKKMKWAFSASSDGIEVKLVWIKALEPVTKTEKPTQALKKRQSPSTRRRNAKRYVQWKEARNKAVVTPKTTETTQTEVLQKTQLTQTSSTTSIDREIMTTTTPTRDRGTSDREAFRGRAIVPTKYKTEPKKQWKTTTTVRSPYNPEQYCYKTEFYDGDTHFSEAFDIDNPGYSTPDEDTAYMGDRPPTPEIPPQRSRSKVKATRKKHH